MGDRWWVVGSGLWVWCKVGNGEWGMAHEPREYLIPSAARDLVSLPRRQGMEARSLVASLLGMRCTLASGFLQMPSPVAFVTCRLQID